MFIFLGVRKNQVPPTLPEGDRINEFSVVSTLTADDRAMGALNCLATMILAFEASPTKPYERALHAAIRDAEAALDRIAAALPRDAGRRVL